MSWKCNRLYSRLHVSLTNTWGHTSNQPVWLCPYPYHVLAEPRRYSLHGADLCIFCDVTGPQVSDVYIYLRGAGLGSPRAVLPSCHGGDTPPIMSSLIHRYSGTSTMCGAPAPGSAGLPWGRHTGSEVSLPRFKSHSAAWL